MDGGPGLSIFQGSGSIKLDTSINRIEEEEAIEDHRRRNEELGNQLQNAFDDLTDEDEVTVDLSADIHSHYTQPTEQQINNSAKRSQDHRQSSDQNQQFAYTNLLERSSDRQKNDHKECRMEYEKLQKCVESKTREIEALTKLLYEERKKTEDNKKRLDLAEAEKDRTEMKAKQIHELLVESKTKILEADTKLKNYETTIENVHKKNDELVAEIEATKLQLSDAQQKYRMIERNANYSADMRAENLAKEAHERHLAQVAILQQQIDTLRGKLDVKDREYSSLEVRYKELEKNRENLLSEKSEVMTQLARSMEESQKHYQDAASKKAIAQENERLQRFVQQLEAQIDAMQRTIEDLRTRLDATAAELNLMEDLVEQNTEISGSLRRLGISKDNTSKNQSVITVNDRIIRLRDELYRCIAGQKEKREEIRKLQRQLQKQSEEINSLRVSENHALIQMTTTNEENSKLSSKIRSLEVELNELRSVNRQGDNLADDLMQKLRSMKDDNMSLTEEVTNLKSACDTTNLRNKELQLEVKNLLEQLESRNASDELIKALKEKAKQFEEYIQNENKSRQSSSSSTIKFQDRGVTTSPELRVDLDTINSQTRSKIESSVRNDMAKIFASQIKQIEEAFFEKCNEMDMQNDQFKKDMHSIYTELQAREVEVEALKHAILKEREKMREIVETKNIQLCEVNAILEKCRDQLKIKQQHIDQIQMELKERSTLIESERRSMKAVMLQWNEQQKESDRINKTMEEKIRKLEEQHRETLEAMQAKVISAKKIAKVYQRYAEDKEKHMLQELERIKAGYDKERKKLEYQMHRKIEEHMAKFKKRGLETELVNKGKNNNLEHSSIPNNPSL